ncbi:MAG TPA: class I SAM-dependent methyltransferase [Fibrobacteria bacterium]|nr:class I SAM-dependent methyltransferase [Fibrobacteria bacterium]
MANGQCRFCRAPLRTTFIDLGMSPLCQDILAVEDLDKAESFYPLHVFTCDRCLLVQLKDYVGPERIFSEYAYFSSFSDTLLRHSEAFAESAVGRFGLGPKSQVVEVASNDGYLLRFFKQRGVPVLGIEPAANVAKAASDKGIPTVVRFFGADTARAVAGDGFQADLLCANNVLPHVPDINDFTAGIKGILKPGGVAVIEFQHLMRMMEGLQFDTIYQEHFSYLTLTFVEKLFADHGLAVFDVEEIPTHGGSLRVFARHAGAGGQAPSLAVAALLAEEERRGMNRVEGYAGFRERVHECKRGLLDFLIRARREGKTVAGYGAAGKTNTLLNYCGIRTDFIDYTVDRNPYKQGKFLPGTHIPVHKPERIRETRPDFLFVGVWNMLPEVMEQTAYIREWGGRWLVPIPEVRVLD